MGGGGVSIVQVFPWREDFCTKQNDLLGDTAWHSDNPSPVNYKFIQLSVIPV